jgi:hypothetical protein
LSDGETILHALGHNSDDGSFVDWIHESTGGCETWTHDVSAGENESDSSFVDLLLGQEHGIFVEELEGRHPRSFSVAEEELVAGSIYKKFNVIMAKIES